MKKKVILGIALCTGMAILGGCGKTETTAQFLTDNQEYLKRYEVNEDDKINRIRRSAIYEIDLGDLDVLNEEAELVILGEVMEEPYTIPQLLVPYTFYSVRVEEVIKGEGLAEPGEIIAAGERQGIMTSKDVKDLYLKRGGKYAEFFLKRGPKAPDEELEQIYLDFTNGPQLHTGDRLIFVMEEASAEKYLTDAEGTFWYICGDEYGKFYEIEENQYMRIFSSKGESDLTREITEIEVKAMDEVFSLEELENLF